MPAVRVVVRSALTIVALALLIKVTLLARAIFMHIFKKFRKPDTGLDFG